jgi:hypothetical protein
VSITNGSNRNSLASQENLNERPRLSFHLDEPDRRYFIEELARVAVVDGLGGRAAMGVLLHRVAMLNLRLDERSVLRYMKLLADDGEPREHVHLQRSPVFKKPAKRARASRRRPAMHA